MSDTNCAKSCPKCGARWFYENDVWQHYWNTGKKGNEIDLNSLVCVPFGDDTCINPCKNSEIEGDTWEKRLNNLSSKSFE